MKVVIPLIVLLLISCEQRNITGYIVYKKHVPKHMCCDDYVKVTTEAAVIVVPMQNHHVHEEQNPTWTLYVGNSYGTHEVDVTPSCYNSFHVTDKVKVYGNSVELIKKGCR